MAGDSAVMLTPSGLLGMAEDRLLVHGKQLEPPASWLAAPTAAACWGI
jgi:hypothetical protein